MTLPDQPGQIVIDCMMGHSAHGDGIAPTVAVAGSEGDLQLAAGQDGIFVEHLIEITQTEKQQHAGMLPLDVMILAHHGTQIFHFSWCLSRLLPYSSKGV